MNSYENYSCPGISCALSERHLPYNFLTNSPIIIQFPSTQLNWAYYLLVSDEDVISWTKKNQKLYPSLLRRLV
jgi:hypothetical protein